MRSVTASGLEATIREYFDGCNEASAEKMLRCFVPDAVHYFPAGAPQGTFFGAHKIADGWISAVRKFGSVWTVDRVIVDAHKLEAVIEWTHFKPNLGVYLRGDEWYVFAPDGRIREIRAYYACPAAVGQPVSHELGEYPYVQLGYPQRKPDITR